MRTLIAGGSGLIGSALVDDFRKRGIEVINGDINGGQVYFDMGHPERLSALLTAHGPFDGFVNCTYPEDLQVATRGWLDCTRRMVVHLSAHGGGAMVNFGSIYGMVGSKMDLYEGTKMTMKTEYAFIKGGIIAASRDIATKYAKYNVRCNVVSPGGVYDNQPEKFVKRYEKHCPMGRMACPEDIIELVWLLLNPGSEYITGCNFPIDGGWTAW